jgi:broad specificity phosphatase PhoE
MAEIVLIRHGETAWSAAHRHTSYTDVDLTEEGERQARALARCLAGRTFAAVHCSPRRRARRTAELAGLSVTAVDDDLAEWDYGRYEGITTDEIRRQRPDWELWTDGCPGGESPDQVGTRLDRALSRAAAQLAGGDVAVIAHGHSLRVAGARWIGLPAGGGGKLRLDTATVSTLGHEHGRPVIQRWNQAVPVAPPAAGPDRPAPG